MPRSWRNIPSAIALFQKQVPRPHFPKHLASSNPYISPKHGPRSIADSVGLGEGILFISASGGGSACVPSRFRYRFSTSILPYFWFRHTSARCRHARKRTKHCPHREVRNGRIIMRGIYDGITTEASRLRRMGQSGDANL